MYCIKLSILPYQLFMFNDFNDLETFRASDKRTSSDFNKYLKYLNILKITSSNFHSRRQNPKITRSWDNAHIISRIILYGASFTLEYEDLTSATRDHSMNENIRIRFNENGKTKSQSGFIQQYC